MTGMANTLVQQPEVSEKLSTVSTSPLSNLQFACTHQYCAFPWNKNEICVWDTANLHEQPMILKGHHKAISAVAIQQYGDEWLACSASQEYVITWDLNDCRQNVLQGLLPHGLVIGTLIGDVQLIAFHPNQKLVVTCTGTRVFILRAQREEILAELAVHQGPVTGAEFWSDHFLVCISEDRTFSVWDYHAGHLVYQSGIISAFPLLNMCIDEENEQLVTGCSDGMLRAFSLVKGHSFRSLCNIDLKKEKMKFYRLFEKFGRSEREKASDNSLGNDVESGLPILHIMKYKQQLHELHMPLLGKPSLLWIGSSTDSLLTNMATSEVEAVLRYKDYNGLRIHVAGSISMSCETGKKDFCLISSQFESRISLLEFDTSSLWQYQQQELRSCALEANLSVLSRNPLLSTSPLCSPSLKKTANTKTNVLRTKMKDQPLVFNNKIKSTGYAAAPKLGLWLRYGGVRDLLPQVLHQDSVSRTIDSHNRDQEIAGRLATEQRQTPQIMQVMAITHQSRDERALEGSAAAPDKTSSTSPNTSPISAVGGALVDVSPLSSSLTQQEPPVTMATTVTALPQSLSLSPAPAMIEGLSEVQHPSIFLAAPSIGNLTKILQSLPTREELAAFEQRMSQAVKGEIQDVKRELQSLNDHVKAQREDFATMESRVSDLEKRLDKAQQRMKMFSPKTNLKKSQFSAVKKKVLSDSKKGYPMDSMAPTNLQRQITLSERPTSASCIKYSGDGIKLACGLSDKSLLVFSSTLKGEPAVFTGHDGAINGLDWSYNRNLLVSTADDRTMRIWNAKTADVALILGKEIFSSPIRFPQFYYLDTFILLSSGAEIHLMKYNLDNSKNDLKRYEQKGVCKTVEKFHLDSVEITGVSAVNDFYSYIVLAAGTNRTVEVFDLNVSRRIATIPEVHPRAAHQICQNKGSAFSTQPPEAYNLFVTMAICDSIKLWDIRTLRCVRHYEGHVNRYLPCHVAISPCARFIACGSEDRCAYIYDTRSSTYLEKLRDHTESVINVAFSPSTAQLTTCTVDGTLRTFTP